MNTIGRWTNGTAGGEIRGRPQYHVSQFKLVDNLVFNQKGDNRMLINWFALTSSKIQINDFFDKIFTQSK